MCNMHNTNEAVFLSKKGFSLAKKERQRRVGMIRVAICDDNKEELALLKNLIEEYRKVAEYDIFLDEYTDGEELISHVESGANYDLVFLDVVMPHLNGIEVAKVIHQQNKVTKLVFLTSSPEYAVESYSVTALDYLLKPLTEEKFNRAIGRFNETHKSRKVEEIIVQEKGSIFRVAIHTICYIEVLDHYLLYHLINKETLKCRQSLSEIADALRNHTRFAKPHRSYIVNLDYVAKLESKTVTMTEKSVIPVARGAAKTFSDAYLRYKFVKEAKA